MWVHKFPYEALPFLTILKSAIYILIIYIYIYIYIYNIYIYIYILYNILNYVYIDITCKFINNNIIIKYYINICDIVL
jgi:hypothetical protein